MCVCVTFILVWFAVGGEKVSTANDIGMTLVNFELILKYCFLKPVTVFCY